MSFNGKLLYLYNEKTKEYDPFPLEYIYRESYNGAKEVQDLDSTRNANGRLKRNVLEHVAFTITFSTRPMWNTEMNKVFRDFINKHYLEGHEIERKLKVKFYVNETDDYDSGEFYVATPKFKVNRIDGNKIFYDSVEISMIQY